MARKVGTIEIDLVAQLAKFEQDINKANSKLNSLDSTVKKLADSGFSKLSKGLLTLQAGLSVTNTAFNALAVGVRGLMDLVERGQSFKELSTSFNALYSGTVLARDGIAQLRAATQGLLSDSELMQEANKAALSELDPNMFLQAAKAADALGDAVGKGTREAFELLAGALETGQTKLLRQLRLKIDLTTAEKQFREQLNHSTGALTEEGKLQVMRIATMNAVAAATAKVGESSDTAGDAQQRLEAAFKNLFDKVAAGVTQNKDLKQAFEELTTAINNLPIEKIQNFFAAIISGTASAISALTSFTEYFSRGMEALFDTSNIAKIADINNELKEQNEILKERKQLHFAYPGKDRLVAETEKEINDLTAAKQKLIATERQHRYETGEFIGPQKTANEVLKETAATAKDAGTKFFDESKEVAKAAKESAKMKDEVDKLRQSLTDLKSNSAVEDLNKQIEKAFEAKDFGAIGGLAKQLGELTKQGVLAGYEDAFKDLKGEQLKQAQEIAKQSAEFQGQKAEQSVDERVAPALKEAHIAAVETWQTVFENAITGEAFNLEDIFKQLAVGFASEIMASLVPGVSSLGSVQGIGSALASSIFGTGGSGLTGLFSGAGGAFASGGTSDLLGGIFGTGYGSSSTLIGPPTEAGMAGMQFASALPYLGIAGGAAGLYSVLSNNKKDPLKGAASGAALGAGIGTLVLPGIGTAIGAALGGAGGGVIGALFGKGSKDADTESRHLIVNFIEDKLKNSNLSIFEGGAFKDFGKNFLEGSGSAFKQGGGGFDTLLSLPETTQQVFQAFAQGMATTLGVTQDIAPQIAALLATNLSGSIDNAKLLVQQLGLDFDTMSQSLLQAATQGTISWGEFAVQIDSLNQLFEPGLAAVGDFVTAFQQFQVAGDAGVASLTAVKNIAVEALQAGIDTFAGLEDKLLATGQFTQQEISALFEALQKNGIFTLSALAAANDITAGKIVGDVQNIIAAWDKAHAAVDATGQAIKDLPDGNVNVNVNTNVSGPAAGGVTGEALDQAAAAASQSVSSASSGGGGGGGRSSGVKRTDSRKEALKKIEEFFKDVLGKTDKFVGVNEKKLDKFFKKLPSDVRGVFGALAEAIKKTAGVTEDVGKVISEVLAKSLASDLEKTRKMIQALSIDFESLTATMLDSARKGKTTWAEFLADLKKSRELFTPGLAGKGDIAGAIGGIMGSKGKGFATIQGLRDLAVEAMDLGGTSLADLAGFVSGTGLLTADQLSILMSAISSSGVADTAVRAIAGQSTDFADFTKKLKDAGYSQESIDSIIYFYDRLGASLEEIASGSALSDLAQAPDELAGIIAGGLGAQGAGFFASDVIKKKPKRHALGGIVNSPTMFVGGGSFGLMGEAGPEAILPLTRVNGKLGVDASGFNGGGGQSVVFQIDASGAQAGVEHQIMAAIKVAEKQIIRNTMTAVANAKYRGGF